MCIVLLKYIADDRRTRKESSHFSHAQAMFADLSLRSVAFQGAIRSLTDSDWLGCATVQNDKIYWNVFICVEISF